MYGRRYILDKPIATASAGVVLLELDKLQLAKRRKNILQVLFGDTKVDVSDVESVERHRVGVGARSVRVAHLPVLFCLGELDDDGDA